MKTLESPNYLLAHLTFLSNQPSPFRPLNAGHVVGSILAFVGFWGFPSTEAMLLLGIVCTTIGESRWVDSPHQRPGRVLLACCVKARETNHIVTGSPLSQCFTPSCILVSLRVRDYSPILSTPYYNISHTYTFRRVPALCSSPSLLPFATSTLSLDFP